MVSQARSQCKTMFVNKALVLSVRRHHARVTHQIMLLVLSSAGALGAKGSNEKTNIDQKKLFIRNSNDFLPPKWPVVFSTSALLIFHLQMRDKEWRVLTFVSLLFGVLKFRSLSSPKILLELFQEESLFFRSINLM